MSRDTTHVNEQKPYVLVIEDESAIADTVTYALQTEGMETIWCQTGREGVAVFARGPAQLVILDIGLPDGSGFDVYRELQSITPTPVIFLTARAQEIDRVAGLEMGADDYVTKPFSPRELSARVRAVLRRTRSQATPQDDGGARTRSFMIDMDQQTIAYRGEALNLTRVEFRLLAALIEKPGRVWSRAQLLQRAWDAPDHRLERTVDTHVKSVRAKLREVCSEADPIRTHRGSGYSLDADA